MELNYLNEAESFLQEIIDISLFPHEKLIFENALKYLEINITDIFAMISELNNKQYNSNIPFQVDLVNLPKTKLAEVFYNRTQSPKIDDFFNTLNKISVILLQKLKIEDQESYYIAIQAKENYENLTRERFMVSSNFQTETKKVNESMKGHQSFRLSTSKNENKLKEVLQFLIENIFIDKGTKLIYFKKIFSGDVIIPKEKINWTGSYYELYYFVKLLGEKIKNSDDKFHTATRCFLKDKKDVNVTQLTKSNGSKINFDNIKATIDLFD